MNHKQVLISIISLFLVLGFIALIYPSDGIAIAGKVVRYPKLTDIFVKAESATVMDSASDSAAAIDPVIAIQ